MEGFTVGLALVDAIPVLSFGISMVIIASRFDSPLFLIGAALSVLAGCCKVAWKMVLGIAKKDLRWLNKPFVPMQATGFLLMMLRHTDGRLRGYLVIGLAAGFLLYRKTISRWILRLLLWLLKWLGQALDATADFIFWLFSFPRGN